MLVSVVFHSTNLIDYIAQCTLSEVMVDLGKKGGGATMKDQSC